jgi:hypothetical protein
MMPRMSCRLLAGVFPALGLLVAGLPQLYAQTQLPPDPRSALPERPTVATHAHTVAVGIVEIETGVQAYHPQAGETEYDTPSLVKVGLASHLQLDVYEGISAALSQTGQNAFGIGDVSAGLKWRALDRASLLGDFAVQSTVKFATGSASKGTGTGTTDLNVILISSNGIGPASLDVNVGFTVRSGDGSVVPTRATFWTMSWGLPIRGRVGWAAEVFGFPGTQGPSGERPIVALLTGPTCVIRRYLVIDGGFIARLAGPQSNTVYAGLTWNVGRLWHGHAPTNPARQRPDTRTRG